MCSICQLHIRADSLWEPHLAGRPHRIALQKLQEAKQQKPSSASTRSELSGKKRKADDEDEDEDRRKKMRAVEEVPDRPIKLAPKEVEMASHGSRPTTVEPQPPAEFPQPSTIVGTVDEDEWAAFERDVATPPPQEQANLPSAITAQATISAAPVSAAELAARSREEASIQAKEKREAELEGEKEDAARQLEEEFDEMDELEGKVRRLREMREALRTRRTGAVVNREQDGIEDKNNNKVTPVVEKEDEDSDADDDDYDEFEDWGLR